MSRAEPAGVTGARDLHHLPATELVRLLREGEVASAELLEHFLDRIDRLDGPINAVVALDTERARQRAAAADAAQARGESWGPLHGLPMTVKDAFETAGLVTTSGAPELRDHVPATDADAVARLTAAGAVVFGKTNLPLYAGDLQTYNDVYGRTNNPWAPDRTVGGSSGGSAAALAAGMTGLELGSDIGGSIRNPAHFCGVFGLKPTWGIVPERGHIPGPPGSLAPTDVGVVGPLGRSAADLALALDVLAGPAGDDAAGWRLELPPARNGGAVEGLRVATWFDDPFVPIARDTRARLDAAAAALAGAGAEVTAVDPPVGLAELARSWERLVLPLVAARLSEDDFAAFCAAADAGPVAGDEDPGVRALRAMVARHRHWASAHEARHRHRRRFAELFRDHDVLLAPVMPTAAYPHDTEVDIPLRTVDVDGEARSYLEGMYWCGGIGTLLLPVAVPPVGRTPEGLPVGVQVVAPHLHDRTAVAVAGHLEQLLGGFVPPPAFAGASAG
jgi:amidase